MTSELILILSMEIASCWHSKLSIKLVLYSHALLNSGVGSEISSLVSKTILSSPQDEKQVRLLRTLSVDNNSGDFTVNFKIQY